MHSIPADPKELKRLMAREVVDFLDGEIGEDLYKLDKLTDEEMNKRIEEDPEAFRKGVTAETFRNMVAFFEDLRSCIHTWGES